VQIFFYLFILVFIPETPELNLILSYLEQKEAFIQTHAVS